MTRKFFSLLIFIALATMVGSMACLDLQTTIDRTDETDGATG